MDGCVRIEPHRRTFVLAGEIDESNASELTTAIVEADWLDDGPVHFDLSALTFMDSSGFRALMLAYTVGRTLVLDSATQAVRQLFEILGLDKLPGVALRNGSVSRDDYPVRE
jgi:anti-anti-sigma factor